VDPGCRPTPEWGKELAGLEGLEGIGEGAFPRFSPDGSLITFTREIDNEEYEIFTMRPDGGDVRCLTCDQPALAHTRWKGQSSWHPSGDYLVFTAETDEHPRFLSGTSTRPGLGRNHDVWIMRSDGSRFWRVTDYPENWGAMRPVFSGDGALLLWNEEFSMELYPEGKRRDLKIADDPPDTVGHAGSYWGHLSMVYRLGEESGAWRIKLADVSFPGGEPEVTNLRDIEPPRDFTLIEAAGFTPLDDGLIASYADLEENRGRSFWGDIYVVDLNGNIQQRLTATPFEHDENPVFSPDGRFVLWNIASKEVSSRGEELWLLNLWTGRKRRLTYFTDPGHPEYDPFAGQITEISWDPSGRRAVFGHVSQAEPGTAHLPSFLYLVTF
jgi:Tol biopolymer transport system component